MSKPIPHVDATDAPETPAPDAMAVYQAAASAADESVAQVMRILGQNIAGLPDALTAGAIAAIVRFHMDSSGVRPDEITEQEIAAGLVMVIRREAAQILAARRAVLKQGPVS